ncbi:hypothetical protein UFOVP1470_22 [uncultured Caudovirales phage]|uniref:Uncharacterized protein n=1 Tax=uncultured Caudovirales phage TaxID=2100421 RepID=A0A6J7XFE4_9CAUD|nr:hypothetical protein UFOVP939_4 [uncultured Caudovirales phage]CAB4178564.1 hypothetical protein UFOVP1018_20 [uncultured Caudovirales phage]CAB4183976.1 hypothetical protein UFOVP1105_21 [uncultured Caudovirales phage]CAB4202401.1 hypothetical protein UFOVP1372_11 [uncultured Caudovirales phage]CAB4215007.1 hypothetical protein UFOVP1470_22 [uncultured Caudovirales phage]
MSGSGGTFSPAPTPAPVVQPPSSGKGEQMRGFLEAPQMGLADQLRMFQQYKGAQNALEQKPQSDNPYQQMQDQRYQQMLRLPLARPPTGLIQNYMTSAFNKTPSPTASTAGTGTAYASPKLAYVSPLHAFNVAHPYSGGLQPRQIDQVLKTGDYQ